MAEDKRNDAGEIITCDPQLRKPEYGTGVFHGGVEQVNWGYHAIDADNNGFDTKNIEENGYYKIKVSLPQNTIIIRYGPETGSYTAPDGTAYNELSLPYVRETIQFHKYIVLANNIDVTCIVERGRAASVFDEPGGGVQYHHERTVRELVSSKILGRLYYDKNGYHNKISTSRCPE